ncbi:group II intron reverse transcriptase/maturase [Oleiagrimonas sp.]|jgi:RNA-directed DNA polymerase|uniref:group II intron reverse transcriptase/maturase n=1 Tax=Oleiagrimonas sp. TaxID=2010330 RepID=UPI00262B3FF2|nr:group II intron reverse transcriptase/maturase [Oleiagrimonas sp.]MDA3913245.1 group II intron reverse transcriptase/maturase [Oleiagrimonas sp.]
MKSTKTEARKTSGAHTQEAGQYPAGGVVRAEAASANHLRTKAQVMCESTLMDAAMERDNLRSAYQRVIGNKGAGGVDGIGIEAFAEHLKRHWPTIKANVLAGTYIPSPVRRVDIPKPQGGVRTLGIPTLTDRMIQQALHQVLQPIFEAEFSASSYGFRPGKNAHQAVKSAQRYIDEGRRVVVDMDLEKFFDRVNHDLLMGKLADKIGDGRVLKLIRRYLEAGMMADGTVSPRTQGTPQGGPLSPLLSNILLTELDRELERRGHAFCRYADDCNIYVKSHAAGERVLASLTRFLTERLKLKVNAAKSAVDRPWRRMFLGYSTTWHKQVRLRIPASSRQRFKARLRAILKGARGRSLYRTIRDLNPVLRGWAAYYKLTQTKAALDTLDGWLRRKLRCILWRQWKRTNARARHLMKAGLAQERAWRSATNGRGPWWNSGASHMNAAFPKAWFDRLGLVSLLDTARRLQCRL